MQGDDRSEDAMREVMVEGLLGNALDLSGALYERWSRGDVLPDFNLDADRGYGYLCWTQAVGAPEPPHTPDPLVTHDAGGNPIPVQLEILPS
jgi:hypothetical protein